MHGVKPNHIDIAELVKYFCIPSLIWNTIPQHVTCSDCLDIFLAAPNMCRAIFYIHLFWKLIQRLPFTWIICTLLCSSRNWNFVINPFRSGGHGYFKDVLILPFIIVFTSIFVQFLIFSKHICSYSTLLIGDWSIPMLTICCLSWSHCNTPMIMTHDC